MNFRIWEPLGTLICEFAYTNFLLHSTKNTFRDICFWNSEFEMLIFWKCGNLGILKSWNLGMLKSWNLEPLEL